MVDPLIVMADRAVPMTRAATRHCRSVWRGLAMQALMRVALALLLLAGPPVAAPAQELSALARLDPAASSIRASGQGVDVVLALSQPVPWRVRLLDAAAAPGPGCARGGLDRDRGR